MRWWRVATPTESALDLALSAEEGFVLSRLDVPLEERQIAELTGLPPERVAYIVALLADKRLVEGDTPSMRPEAKTIPDAEYTGEEPLPDVSGAEPVPSVTTKPILDAVAALAHASPDDPAVIAGRDWLRARYGEASGELRAEIIGESEGAVLRLLDGVSLDARTTALLCARTIASGKLVDALARMPTCPRLLLAHLLKQQVVRRSPQLKRLVLMHPNLPPEARKRG